MQVSDQRKTAWDEIARKLAATGCPGRTGQDIRTAWSELKKRAKKYEDEKKKTGKPPIPHPSLVAIGQTVVKLCVKREFCTQTLTFDPNDL